MGGITKYCTNIRARFYTMNYQIKTLAEVRNELREHSEGNGSLVIDSMKFLESFNAYEYDVSGMFDDLIDEQEDFEDDEKIDYPNVETHDAYDIMQALEDICDWEEVSHDNTYNWNAPMSNNIDFHVYKDTGEYYYVFAKMHKFGDVRGNYTDYFVLQFDTQDDFYTEFIGYTEQLDEMIGDWALDLSLSSEEVRFYNTETHDDFEAYVYDMEDAKEKIAEHESE